MSISIHDYFENIVWEGLFDDQKPVWAVLEKNVKENWLEKNLTPNASAIETQDGLVTKYQKVRVPRGTFEIYPGAFIKDTQIEISEGCIIESGAFLAGPTLLGPQTIIRQGAYVRGGVITASDCVIGHATEVKSSIFFTGAKAAHFAYVGDSVLGQHVNLGAGTKISNLKITETPIVILAEGKEFKTGLRKFGAILGDGVQTGCNSVLNPGTILGKGSMVYPASAPKAGVYKAKSIIR